MKRLTEYTREALEKLSPAGGPALSDFDDNAAIVAAIGEGKLSLRNIIRAEVAAGHMTGLTGSDIAAMSKLDCIDILTGRNSECFGNGEKAVAGSNGHAAAAEAVAPRPVALPPGGDAGLSSLAGLLAPYMPGAAFDREEVRRLAAEAFVANAGPLVEELRRATSDATVNLADTFAKLREELLQTRPVSITIVREEEGIRIEMDRQHFMFQLLLLVVQARCHAFLVGPAGSGKTSVCHAVADSLGLTFDAVPVCQQTTQTALLGYMDANGIYRGTSFRRFYEHGGVFVLDEIDNGNANVLAVLNGALANDAMSFPDGARVPRHKDFILIACGNTYGNGADRLYAGRNQLDAATLDRFCFIDFAYDEGFEMHLCEVKGRPSPSCNPAEGGEVTADGWVSFVQGVRAAIAQLKVRHIVSPRASIYGVKLAEKGVGRAWLEKMLIWKGLDDATVAKIRAAMK